MGRPVTCDHEHVRVAAIEITKRDGFKSLSRSKIEKQTGMSGGTISRMFGGMDGLREEVVKHAIDQLSKDIKNQSMLDILLFGMAEKYQSAIDAPNKIKVAAIQRAM